MMSLRRVFVLALCTVAGSLGVARADDTDALRTMLGLSNFGALQSAVNVGALPKDGFPIPQPKGLSVVGSATATSNGKVTNEILYYVAPEGSVPDVATYAQDLINAGWQSTLPMMPPSVFASSLQTQITVTVCKKGGPGITVHAARQYLIIRADAFGGMCTMDMPSPNRMNRRPTIAKAPYPVFTAPDGSSFAGATKATFTGVSDVTATGITSNESGDVLLGAFAKQMMNAGWTARSGSSGSDGEGFRIRDKSGDDWVASLSVVNVSDNLYLLTVSAFKVSETGVNAVTAAR
jgi:hypothetical protein